MGSIVDTAIWSFLIALAIVAGADSWIAHRHKVLRRRDERH
jgi:hypothetical protein